MTEIPETRHSLLVRVRDPRDHEAWDQFARIYRPVAYRLARAHGLQDADAEELAQSVLMAIDVANRVVQEFFYSQGPFNSGRIDLVPRV